MAQTAPYPWILLAAAAAACGTSAPPGDAAHRSSETDTLSGGTVVVRNRLPRPVLRRLDPDLVIGATAGDRPDGFSRIWDLAVDATGRIYVFERLTNDIRVFDSTGAFVRTIGREGSGPGEIRNGAGMVIDGRGRIWVADAGSGRYTVFDDRGTLLWTANWSQVGYYLPRPRGFDRAGHLVAVSPVRVTRTQVRDVLLVLDSTLQVLDSLAIPYYEAALLELHRPDGRLLAVDALPFAPRQHWVFHPPGALWLGVSSSYRLAKQTLAGDTLLILSLAATPERVTQPDLDRAAAGYAWYTDAGGTLDLSAVADTKPLFSAIHVDDGDNLWVARRGASGADETLFDVFDAGGVLTRQVAVNRTLESNPLPVIRRGYLYGVVLDELDVPFVIRVPVDPNPR